MIDYLVRQELVVPGAMGPYRRSRGRRRRFTFANLMEFRTYAALLERGVSVKRLKEAHANWRNYFAKAGSGMIPQRFLVTDGNSIYFRDSDEVVADLTKSGQFVFSFIVDMEEIRKGVNEEIARRQMGKSQAGSKAR